MALTVLYSLFVGRMRYAYAWQNIAIATSFTCLKMQLHSIAIHTKSDHAEILPEACMEASYYDIY